MAMKTAVIFCIFAAAFSEEVSPIQKVVQMLSDLQTKVIGEGTDAQKVYSEFAEWCETRSREVQFEIKTGKSNAASLQATIDEEGALIASLDAKYEKLAGELAADEADLKASTEIRDHEYAVFVAQEAELSEVVDTLGRAATIIEREMSKGGASMMQLKNAGSVAQAITIMMQASEISSADGARLTALIQSSQDSNDAGAPAGAVYESQSGNILDVLSDLRQKAEDQLSAARHKETENVNNFGLLKQSMDDEIKFGKSDMARAKKGSAASSEKKAMAEGDLDVTSKDLKEDNTASADLHHDCMTKAQDFEAATKSRAEELEALATAKKVILDSTSGAASQSYSFVQVAGENAQIASVRFVRELSRKQGSAALAQLAVKMASVTGDDIFGKVKGLIAGMIAKLEEEAEAGATKKAYCSKELAYNNEKRDNKQAEIAKLTSKVDQDSAKSAQLKEQNADLQKQLANLASSQAEMNKVRADENTAYKSNKAEMEEGVQGVKLALKVLRDYYAQDDKAHQEASGAGQGIVGLLEVVESDFSKGLAEQIATEESSTAAYDKETKENEIETASKQQDVKYKKQESASLDKAASEDSSDRSGVQEELDAVLDVLRTLHGECDELLGFTGQAKRYDMTESYKEKTARRNAEITGLRQALTILEDDAALMQTNSQRSKKGIRIHA